MRERRSLLNFAALIIVAVGTALFLLWKAQEAIAEIERLQRTIVEARQQIGPEETLP